jgi:hypothetical protein
VAALLCGAALAAGCGSSGEASEPVQHSSQDVGESVRSDTCAQWRAGTEAQRDGTLIRLRRFAGAPVGSSASMTNGPVLTDQRARKILDSFCSRPFARAFKLYKLYTRAAGFIGN